MQITEKKLKLIYLPFIAMTISLLTIYTFLNWLLVIKTNMFFIRQEIIVFCLPFGLALLTVLIWFRAKIKLLNLTEGNRDLTFLYQATAVFAMAVPTIVAQRYVEIASGTLTSLDNINQIKNQEPTKYYALKNFYIDKVNVGVHSTFDISGKNDQSLNMHLYIALPILESEADVRTSNCLAWLGHEYSKKVSNMLNLKEKEEKYKAFLKESQKDFDNKHVNQFVYLDRVGNNADGDGYKEAVQNSRKYSPNNTTVFLGINEPFENRNGYRNGWPLSSVFGAFGIASGIWLIMLLVPNLNESEVCNLESGKPSIDNEIHEFIEFLKPTEGFFITPIIIYLNILMFLVMVFAGLGVIAFKGQDLLSWGANFRPSTTNGEWWRLLTSAFLHGGLMHLAANMYGLAVVGSFLEPLLGRTKYLLAYLLTGILASCSSLWWYDATVSVGASGAIFGLYGLFLALLVTKMFPPDFEKAFLASTIIFIGYNLLMGFNGGIDNAAHIGGLASGFVVGLILYPTLKNQTESVMTGK